VSEPEPTLRRKSTPSESVLADISTPPEKIQITTEDGRRPNPFEECERKATSLWTNGNALYDVDFMVRLNFMALRLTEQIGMID
jgi:hypothetical protein